MIQEMNANPLFLYCSIFVSAERKVHPLAIQIEMRILSKGSLWFSFLGSLAYSIVADSGS